MRPCACTTSSLITPNVTQFEPRLCVFPSALFLSFVLVLIQNEATTAAVRGSFRALLSPHGRCFSDQTLYVLCIMFDLWDKYQAFVTKCICQDWKVTPFTALKQRRCMATVLYRVLFEELCILGIFCLLKKGIVWQFWDMLYRFLKMRLILLIYPLSGESADKPRLACRRGRRIYC